MPLTSWSTTAADNDDADAASGITWPEGMDPAQVNDSARAMMAEIRKDYNNRNIAFSVTKSGNQSVSNGTGLVTWETETVDAGGVFASNKFTATVAGNYLVSANLTYTGGTVGDVGILIRKNGTAQWSGFLTRPAVGPGAEVYASTGHTMILPLAVSDYVDVYYYLASTTGSVVLQASRCNFSGHFVGY